MKKSMVVFMIAVISLILWTGCDSNNGSNVTADKFIGGLVWLNWTDDIAGGSGYPAGFDSANKDFLRCKACHGWDGMGANGGYVRRSANATRPNPTTGTDLSLDFGFIVADEVWHTNGRDFTTLDTSMPAYDQTGGLTQQQASDVLSFLNSGPKIGDYATLDTSTDPVTYSFTSPDLAGGATLYTASCSACHPTVDTAGAGPALGPYFEQDGKYSEGFHKTVYGAGGASTMTRAATGELTGQQVADILAYIQNILMVTGDSDAGGLIWLNWTDDIAGGSGYPAGFDSDNRDFLRCKACHGWDGMGANGGYVRRSANATRPNPTAGTDLSADFASIIADDVWYTSGRAFTTLDTGMPAYDQTGGLTQQQVGDVLAFLNSGPKIGDYAALDTSTDPVTYTFTSPNLADGAALYAARCSACHPTVDTAGVGPALGPYFEGDGKYSEGFHKTVYGAGGTSIMTQAASGNLTGQQAADILAFIQADIEGSTIPEGDGFSGGLVWLNWTDAIAGGGGYPDGFDSDNEDFLRCKACHGWDGMGANGGYVRRGATATRPNPTAGTDLSVDFGFIVADEVWYTSGRDFTTLDTTMPAYDQTGGLTEQQVDDVLEFLNSGPKIGDYAALDTSTDPVTYTFTSPNLAEGATLYTTSCSACHPTVDTAGVGPALGPYFEGDGKYSEGFHKAVYGAGGTNIMTRAVMGSPTGQQVADILAFIQADIEGSTIPEGDGFTGGLVWLNWTDDIAGGSGYPAGFDAANEDFLRCKACHGWDGMGANGGYVRRTANATRPNPTAGADLSVDFGSIVADEVWNTNGRDFTTLDTSMPAYDQTGGLAQQQVGDVLAFLNSGPKIGDYATLDTSADPVTYSFTSPNLAEGATLYGTKCAACHPTVDTAGIGPALGPYFEGDGKFSEGFHKVVYGAGGTSIMTRAVMGNLTGQQAADILANIQDNL